MPKKERTAFTELNEAYVKKHDFPFVIAPRHHHKANILEAFRRRLDHDRKGDVATACRQVESITRLCPEGMLP